MTKAQKEIVEKVFSETAQKLNEDYVGTSAEFSVNNLTLTVRFSLSKDNDTQNRWGTIIGLKNGTCPYSDEVLTQMTKERVKKEVKRWEKSLRNINFTSGYVLV